MPLTPADVHNVAFKKPSIGKRGYDEDEVDAFLDVVEAELSRLIEENADLKKQLDGSGDGTASAPRPVLAKAAPVADTAAPPAAAAAPSGNGHVQAARLLGLAQETADKLTEEARAESDKMVSDAKAQSDALITDATTRAEAAERDSRVKAEALDAEAKARYDQVLGTLSAERVGLEKKIADLRTYEREYRGRLKSWISDQLSQLDNGGNNGQPAAPILSSPGE
ncbi:MAG: DivIVA domain-containing protein [Nakamurella sp.]